MPKFVPKINVYISIGNSNNKLPQQKWAEYYREVDEAIGELKVHGRWTSSPVAPKQNACWSIDLPDTPKARTALKDVLFEIVTRYGQPGVMWAEAPEVLMVG